MSEPSLLDRLPPVRGRYQANAPLGARTWFGCGGTAEVLFRPADVQDLQAFLRDRPRDVPYTVLGAGSNVLVRDGGISGVVIRLGGPFAEICLSNDDATTRQEFASVVGELAFGLLSVSPPLALVAGAFAGAALYDSSTEDSDSTTSRTKRIPKGTLFVGAAALDLNVALTAAEASLGGLEFLSGIPGTIGGAVAMNAGSYGAEINDVLLSAQALDPDGRLHTLAAADLGFSYRHSNLPPGWIVVSAILRGTPATQEDILTRIADIRTAREASQPVKGKTGGSTFTNPPGRKAWELIDAAGCRGLVRGGAQVSEKHCNFLINTDGATASDLEDLGEEVRRRVMEHSGVELHWEIRRLGKNAATRATHLAENPTLC